MMQLEDVVVSGVTEFVRIYIILEYFKNIFKCTFFKTKYYKLCYYIYYYIIKLSGVS